MTCPTLYNTEPQTKMSTAPMSRNTMYCYESFPMGLSLKLQCVSFCLYSFRKKIIIQGTRKNLKDVFNHLNENILLQRCKHKQVNDITSKFKRMACQNENNFHFWCGRWALSALSYTYGTSNSLRQNGVPKAAVSKDSTFVSWRLRIWVKG